MRCDNCFCPFRKLEAGNDPSPRYELRCLVTDSVKKVRYDAGEILFAEGEPSTSLYSLSQGVVKITCMTRDGREQIVGLASHGSLLVGLQSLEDDYYQYSAVAESPVVACRIRHSGLLHEAHESCEVALKLAEAINAQLAQSRRLMQVMSHKNATSKIASFITLLVPEGKPNGEPVEQPFSRGEIAGLLGLSEETVCRQMAKMKRDGILYAPRGKIKILDWDRLQSIADEVYAKVA